MLISLVSGTYNRLPQLSRMVETFRAQVARSIEYEIVLVDGGSTDGTIEWAKQQADIRLIEHGALYGAIRAFTDGAQAALGQYVLLANDDIEFVDYSVLAAIEHLESHPSCGAVAFQDDRPAPGYEHTGYKVQTMSISVNRRTVSLPYAQVGLYRRWLGDSCGWWGADDSAFGGHTYGGDNYLSARIYEHGFTVDEVPNARVHDIVHTDDLRRLNHRKEMDNSGAYYKRFPEPPVMGEPAQDSKPERLRILYLPVFEPSFVHKAQQLHKHGLRDALRKKGIVWELDYVNDKAFNVVKAIEAFRPHLLLMQAHAPDSIALTDLSKARSINPNMVVINWNGDVYEENLVSPQMLTYLKHVDLQLTVNAGVLDTYKAHGIRAAYWQIGFEPVGELPDANFHDVVFLANAYSDERKAIGRLLQNMPGVNVGLYGRGWRFANGECVYDFPTGAAIYRKAKIAIGDNQYLDQYGFFSNRVFEALANGAFLLHQTVNGLEELTGLQDGVHYVAWSDVDDLQYKIRYWLEPRHEEKRRAIAQTAETFVRSHHSFDCRVNQLFNELLPLIYEPA